MANARTLEADILQRLAAVKNTVVAAKLGHDDSYISRFASGQQGLKLHELQAFFEALGFVVIKCDGEIVSMPKKRADSLAYLAAEAINRSLSDE